MQPLEVIGLDVGEVHTGMARGNTLAKLAEPLGSLKTSDVLTTLKTMQSKHRFDMLVVGLPRNLEGKDTNQTTWTRQWASQVKQQLDSPMFWQDEALTSQQAAGGDEHSQAATMILQDFLDSPKEARVKI